MVAHLIFFWFVGQFFGASKAGERLAFKRPGIIVIIISVAFMVNFWYLPLGFWEKFIGAFFFSAIGLVAGFFKEELQSRG